MPFLSIWRKKRLSSTLEETVGSKVVLDFHRIAMPIPNTATNSSKKRKKRTTTMRYFNLQKKKISK